jgi:hypothetical protein
MHARGWVIAVLVLLAHAAVADPDPHPVKVDALKSTPIVLTDAEGGIYVMFGDGSETSSSTGFSSVSRPPSDVSRSDDDQLPRLFYGPNAKAVYDQVILMTSHDGKGHWDVHTWSPRVGYGRHLGALQHTRDGSYRKSCNSTDARPDFVGLTELSGDKARAVLDKAQFLSSAILRVPHLLARDDHGVYYYVDRIAELYGGKGYRVFVGKKGALKQMPLVDVASDSAGDVFSTKSGDLRLVRNRKSDEETITWVRGGKRTDLVLLDTDDNLALIFKDLGIYGFLGTLCDNV